MEPGRAVAETDYTSETVRSPEEAGDWLLTMSKFRHVCNIGSRPFRFYMRQNLSIFISHIINVKLNNLYCVEIAVDDKLAHRSGWYDSTMFRCTFEFDKFHPLRSFVRITLWQKHKFVKQPHHASTTGCINPTLRREDTIEGECLLTLGELDCLDPSLLPAQFPMEVRYKKVTSRNMLRDKVNGPRVFCDMMLTIPRVSAMASEKGTQTNLGEGWSPQKMEPYPSLLLGDLPVSTGSLSSVESGDAAKGSQKPGGFNNRVPQKQSLSAAGPQLESLGSAPGEPVKNDVVKNHVVKSEVQPTRTGSKERARPPKNRQWPPWPDESDSDFSGDS
ncbi:hypothetical protein GNI_078120 [Gregarina niphandrodes]|uniref:Uncharacterized protein n=1 Tax=Gregarina niphandrodes TaxID=110365 RepID=A0A023B6R1_GRENI|nr:hypothetical protein GNI_078120 [Gregarina niphandrodes]EZG66662.1 hypothetical protein GNI_078120 [Gregarina niphandrodes]|eukprot:XP_011130556.1 hypothetical protein GNI_078120 [Gregarina niphandrodes]